MKKFALTTLLLGVLTGGFHSSAQAYGDDCCNPCCPPSCCDWSFADGKFRVGADYLYWQTNADEVFFGDVISVGETSIRVPSSVDIGSSSISASGSGDSITVPALFADPIRKQFKWESGFRVWLGYELPCDQWELGVAYTYIPGRVNTGFIDVGVVGLDNAIASPFANLVSVGGVVTPVVYTSTAGKWNSTFQYLDVDFARTLRFGECFRLRPHIGFRAAWGDQKFRQVFNGPVDAITGEAIPGAPTNTFVNIHNKFQGYGVEGGLWADYNIWSGLSVVGHVGGSVLYTRFQERFREAFFNATLTTPTITSAAVSSETIYRAVPSLDYFIGVMYADNFCDFDFNIHAGWESHVWFDLNRVTERGDFSTQGLTIGLEVGF